MKDRHERARELAEEALAAREQAERLVEEAERLDSEAVREVIVGMEEGRHPAR